MSTQESLFDLYKKCFSHIIRDDDTVREILAFPENHFILEKIDDKLVGAAVINQNTVIMLCVLPDFRKKGIGSRLLELAEEFVHAAGFDEIKFCDGKDYITPGIPMYDFYAGNEVFFVKRGYAHSWDDDECVDMMMNLSDFDATDKSVGDTIDGVLYKWAVMADFDKVIDCVESGYPDFTEYYKRKSIYSDSSDEKILIAVKDDMVCGALLVGSESVKNIGEVGCTVTRTEYRGQGIATNMVKLGTKELKTRGLKKGFLGYTYTAIVHMYARSGYKICMKYFMGVKKL